MIRRPDGQPYKLSGTLQQFNPQSSAHELFSKWDEEIIRIGGTPVCYFEILVSSNLDELYLEDRSKLFCPCPVELYAYYEPAQQSNMSGLFAIDTPDEEIILELNYQATLKAIGHPPKIGSRIYTPHRSENWIIVDTRLDQFKLWGIFRLQIHCRKFQETTTTGEGLVTQPKI